MADNKGVLAICEVTDGKLASIATELLACGRKLAGDLGVKLGAIVLGSGVSGLAKEAIAFGADKVYVVDDPLLAEYQPDAYLAAMEKVAKEAPPEIVLFGQTAIGRDLAPRLAFRLGSIASMDCLELSVNSDKHLLQTKPVYGGNAQAVFVSQGYPQVATLRAKAVSPLAWDDARQGEVVSVAAGLDPSVIKAKVVQRVKEEVKGIKLEDAQIIVCGGRGIGGPEGFKQLEELAMLLKGAVGATRPPCDNDWVPTGMQIGITGKIVAPEVYIAVALSGASQHTSGCSGAKNIIAINRDAEANIFKLSHYGVVGDWKKVLPGFVAKAKEVLAK